MFSFSAPAQFSTYSSPPLLFLKVMVHCRNLSNCGLSWEEYCTEIRARSLLPILMGFLKRSFSTTKNVNAPFLVMSVLISLTILRIASIGSTS